MSKISSKFITATIIIIGLVMVVFGSRAPALQIWGIDVSNFSTNLGLYIAVVVALQWTFDEKSRSMLLSEVTSITLSNVNVAQSGICNFTNNTKAIKYDDLLSTPGTLFIGFQYSPRIIDDHFIELKKRAKDGRQTIIAVADPDGKAIKYLESARQESDHVSANLRKIKAKISQINTEENVKAPIVIKLHDQVLRYSFVASEQMVWVKMYKNGLGDASIPAICVKSGSELFNFYNEDINAFVKGAKDVNS